MRWTSHFLFSSLLAVFFVSFIVESFSLSLVDVVLHPSVCLSQFVPLLVGSDHCSA